MSLIEISYCDTSGQRLGAVFSQKCLFILVPGYRLPIINRGSCNDFIALHLLISQQPPFVHHTAFLRMGSKADIRHCGELASPFLIGTSAFTHAALLPRTDSNCPLPAHKRLAVLRLRKLWVCSAPM